MIPRFQYYIFDVDGTLLDSARDIVASVRQAFSRHGRTPPPDQYLRGQIGHHLGETFREAFSDYTESQLEAVFQDYRTTYLARNHRDTRVYSGVHEALAALPGEKATATTKGTPTTRRVLELFGLLPHFRHVQGTDGFPPKPEPDVVLRSIDALGAHPDECLMVGDSPVDIEAGKRAGVRTCAVRYGYGGAFIAEGDPDYWVGDLRELTTR